MYNLMNMLSKTDVFNPAPVTHCSAKFSSQTHTIYLNQIQCFQRVLISSCKQMALVQPTIQLLKVTLNLFRL